MSPLRQRNVTFLPCGDWKKYCRGRSGALGDFYFMMLQSDQYATKWHYDLDGNQVYTMLRKRNPIMDSFRKNGLHLPEEKASSNEQKGLDGLLWRHSDGLDGKSSSRNTLHEANSTWEHTEAADDNDSVSRGSMSPDLGDMRRYGCLEGLDWDGDVALDSVEEEEEEDRKNVEDRLRQVIESSLWALVRDFLTSDDVLYTRTTGIKWNIARLYGPFAKLFFFTLQRDGQARPVPLPEWPRFRYD